MKVAHGSQATMVLRLDDEDCRDGRLPMDKLCKQ